MINDINAVVWKEFRELIRQRTSRGGLVNWAIMVGLIGIFIPIQMGKEWVESPVLLLAWAWPSLLAVMWIVADSFAGERERHTLETLLASRLSDRSILYGKILSAVAYGWSIELAGLLVGIGTVNVLHGDEGLLFYPVDWLVGILILSLVAILLISTIGCLTSMHSNSVRAAYQKMSMSIMVLFIAPTLIMSFLPDETKASIFSLFNFKITPTPGMLIYPVVVIILLDAILIWFTLQRFQRPKLILD